MMKLSSEPEPQPDDFKSSNNSKECGHKPDEELPEEIDSTPDQHHLNQANSATMRSSC